MAKEGAASSDAVQQTRMTKEDMAGHYKDILTNGRSAVGSACEELAARDLLADADSLRDKVVLITGGASGIGAAFTRLACALGANVIIGDLNTKAATTLAEDIQNHAAPDQPGSAIVGPETSVTNWEDQLKLFDFVEKKFGKIDVVVSCAGVTEFSKPSFEIDELDGMGRLKAPVLSTLDINLKGSLYTSKLARYYMRKNKVKGHIVLLGSLSSFFGIPMGPMYSISKHAILGFMRSTHYSAQAEGITVCSIHPWFTETPILEPAVKLLLAGLPYCKMQDVVQAIVYGATSKKAAGSGIVVDPAGVMRLPHEASDADTRPEGFQMVFAKRAIFTIRAAVTARDVGLLIAKGLGQASVFVVFLAVAGAFLAYRRLA